MNWFRMYHEARNDAKLRALPDDQFRVWFNLMCYSSEQPERGAIQDYDLELLALEVAHGDMALLQTVLTRLERLRILGVTPTAIHFLNWEKRQYDKPSDTPAAVRERVTRHRQRQQDAPDPPDPVAPPPVTPLKRDVTPRNAIEQNRTDTEESRSEWDDHPDPAQSAPTNTGPEQPLTGIVITPEIDAALIAVHPAAVPDDPPPKSARAISPVAARPKPAAKATAPPGFDWRALWGACAVALGHRPTWGYDVEARAVKGLLDKYPASTPEEFAAYLAYKRHCFPFNQAGNLEVPTFSRWGKDYGAWYSAGCPVTPADGGSHAPAQQSGYAARESANLSSSADAIAQLRRAAYGAPAGGTDGDPGGTDYADPPGRQLARPGWTLIDGQSRSVG